MIKFRLPQTIIVNGKFEHSDRFRTSLANGTRKYHIKKAKTTLRYQTDNYLIAISSWSLHVLILYHVCVTNILYMTWFAGDLLFICIN